MGQRRRRPTPCLILYENYQMALRSSSTAQGENSLVLSAGRSRFTLTCLPTEDFPVLSGGDLPHEFSLSAGSVPEI